MSRFGFLSIPRLFVSVFSLVKIIKELNLSTGVPVRSNFFLGRDYSHFALITFPLSFVLLISVVRNYSGTLILLKYHLLTQFFDSVQLVFYFFSITLLFLICSSLYINSPALVSIPFHNCHFQIISKLNDNWTACQNKDQQLNFNTTKHYKIYSYSIQHFE